MQPFRHDRFCPATKQALVKGMSNQPFLAYLVVHRTRAERNGFHVVSVHQNPDSAMEAAQRHATEVDAVTPWMQSVQPYRGYLELHSGQEEIEVQRILVDNRAGEATQHHLMVEDEVVPVFLVFSSLPRPTYSAAFTNRRNAEQFLRDQRYGRRHVLVESVLEP